MLPLLINDDLIFETEDTIFDHNIIVIPFEFNIIKKGDYDFNTALVWLPRYKVFTYLPLTDGYEENSTSWLLKHQYDQCLITAVLLTVEDSDTNEVVDQMKVAFFTGYKGKPDKNQIPNLEEVREEFLKICSGD